VERSFAGSSGAESLQAGQIQGVMAHEFRVDGREWSGARKSVEFYSGDLEALVKVVLAPRFRNVWLVGGAMLCQRFLELGLVNEIRLTIAPVLLGDGLRLFGGLVAEKRWDLKNVVAYRNGFVELSYAAASTV
jgi:dihydrofolate reductase